MKHLPPLADALFDELERQLGPLAPDNAKSDFQVTGFVIDAKERFQKAGVMPSEEFQFQHGRHLGYQFWMNNQNLDYRRRHLMLHEFVHCFPDVRTWHAGYSTAVVHRRNCRILRHAFHGSGDLAEPLWHPAAIAQGFRRLAARIGNPSWPEAGRTQPRRSESDLTTGHLNPCDILPAAAFTTNMQYAQAWSLVWLLHNHPELQPYVGNFQARPHAWRFS